MLIYAALLNIPEELVDAARVDGLGQFRIFWHIKLPLVLPTIGLVSVLTFVGNFNAFDLIYSVKGALAGPNFASDILGTFFYRTFFGNPAAARQSDHGRGGGDRDVLHHPRRRLLLSLRHAAPPAALRVLRGHRCSSSARRRLGVHAILIAYCAARGRADPARGDELVQGAQRHLRRAARPAERRRPSRSSATPRCSAPRISGPIS